VISCWSSVLPWGGWPLPGSWIGGLNRTVLEEPLKRLL
jgi:hypothetical protein